MMGVQLKINACQSRLPQHSSPLKRTVSLCNVRVCEETSVFWRCATAISLSASVSQIVCTISLLPREYFGNRVGCIVGGCRCIIARFQHVISSHSRNGGLSGIQLVFVRSNNRTKCRASGTVFYCKRGNPLPLSAK